MSTKFFNNTKDNTLFAKLSGIAKEMHSFDKFLAVVGFFRSSGYFRLRKELGDVPEIRVLVGIDVDKLFLKHNPALLFSEKEKEEAKEIYRENFKKDIVNARYSAEVEEGILQMYDDLESGRLQIKIHPTRNLHAKFYLCLPKNHNANSDGWVIMGSSNISESGLGITEPPRYELNVAMKDFDDVDYCHREFKDLWEEGVDITAADVKDYKKETYLGYQPTPYEIYIKVLIDFFGEQVEDDFSLQLPEGMLDLKYQKDAVIQGYQMIMKHNGLFLADVVGLGKTPVATMIAKRFIEANGRHTNILVVFPPALEGQWKKSFEDFGIYRNAQFVSNGSLNKILERKQRYKGKEEFDLIIIDEAHKFRSDGTGMYDSLQKICKSSRPKGGRVSGTQKKVMLLSATPLNNRPEDLKNLLLLFQNSQTCTIDGIPNIRIFFYPYEEKYRKLMADRGSKGVTAEVDAIYEEMRNQLIDKITVRRTRKNILNDPDYEKDLKNQGITFPTILPPLDLTYQMSQKTSALFYETLSALANSDNDSKDQLFYARYRAVEFLQPEARKKYKNPEHIAETLAGIYRVHMVKRLESSFYAFKKSLATLLRITNDMIDMLDANKVIIAPDIKVKDLQAKGMGLDEIIEYAAKKKGYDKEEITFEEEDFRPDFRKMLLKDKEVLEKLEDKWAQVNEDPKYDLLSKKLKEEFFKPEINHSGKLVLFSESVDTLDYLYGKLEEEKYKVLEVTSLDRARKEIIIKENFDANYGVKSNDYNIIITSDVLAEGVNLHRSNVIINYDSPWNATRLMQRIGRVNRIGSEAQEIHNYLFYPSQQGEGEIRLYENALIKLQGFHTAFGEDAQIFSKEEVVKQFKLYDSNIKDNVDKRTALLREVRALYNTERDLYERIKALPIKSRTMRDIGKNKGKSVVYVSSPIKTEFYLVDSEAPKVIDFFEAVGYLKAKREEKPVSIKSMDKHFKHVSDAVDLYKKNLEKEEEKITINKDLDKPSQRANKFLRSIKRIACNKDLVSKCDVLIGYINEGIYSQLPRSLIKVSNAIKKDNSDIKLYESKAREEIDKLFREYQTKHEEKGQEQANVSIPQIIISESFV